MCSMKNNTEETKKEVAVFIDVANTWGKRVNVGQIMSQVNEMGNVRIARAYGDFTQRHLEQFALELYARGIQMVHCPSWDLAGGDTKRSDDRILEKEIRDCLVDDSISIYVLVTSDSDIIPTCHGIREHGRQFMLYSSKDQSLGWLLRSCGFEIREAPGDRQGQIGTPSEDTGSKETTLAVNPCNGSSNPKAGVASFRQTAFAVNRGNGSSNSNGHELTEEELVKEIDHLERTNRFIGFTQTALKLAKGDRCSIDKVKKQLGGLVKEGILENYNYEMPAIRLNRKHRMVDSALSGKDNESQTTETLPVLAEVGVPALS